MPHLGDHTHKSVVAPAILQNPSFKRWLGGIEPAWALLDQANFEALRHPPLPPAGVIRLAPDFSPDEIGRSAVTRNALILLHTAAAGPGLKMTATGNLSRSVVAEMCDLFTWPGFDKTQAFRLHKVVNEPDFLPLFFVRHLVEVSSLLRRRKGYLKITSAGRKVLEDPARQALQALLFHIALWHLDLGYLGRGLHDGWPQRDAGIVLWSLSVAANDWQSSTRLTRMCTVPISGILDAPWDSGTTAMEARILRPLWWFGLLEYRQEDIPGRTSEASHFYRKTPLFDRFLSFGVKLEAVAGSRH
ncbi:hypothetical protein [Reyranella sp.]|uniref:hypothetical protein n=1 Tax=Reyranella sp. TaxID=1929291 RepID=UPI0027313022|nr:hypothetical protein [Reyranella sp.]MDP2372888.1 hypothetical protein [Reyranella sp.]